MPNYTNKKNINNETKKRIEDREIESKLSDDLNEQNNGEMKFESQKFEKDQTYMQNERLELEKKKAHNIEQKKNQNIAKDKNLEEKIFKKVPEFDTLNNEKKEKNDLNKNRNESNNSKNTIIKSEKMGNPLIFWNSIIEANHSFKYFPNDFEDVFYEILEKIILFRHDSKKNINFSLDLLELMKEFQNYSCSIIKDIVDELLTERPKKYQPFIQKDNLVIYNLKEEGILIKIAGLVNQKMDDFISQFKKLANEYKSNMFVLNRLINSMKKGACNSCFRVPLCFIINYLGVRALVYCKSKKIQGEKTLNWGFDSNDVFQKNLLLNENIISNISRIFNIKVIFK